MKKKHTLQVDVFGVLKKHLKKLHGVKEVKSGYTGGHVKNPTYEQVTYEETGHYEAVEVIYDQKKISYDQLLDVFWKNIDPYDAKGQFCDKGSSYLSAVFYQNDDEKKAYEEF